MRERSAMPNPWPLPRQWDILPEFLTLRKPMRLMVRGRAPWLDNEAQNAQNTLRRLFGRTIAHPSGTGPALALCDVDGLPPGAHAVRQPEGYSVSVTSKGACLAGACPAGLSHAVHSLAALAAPSGRALPLCSIRDWPALPIRGHHLYLPPRSQLDFFWRLLDYLAGLKYNTLYLEIGGGMEYERRPEINRAWKAFCRQARAYDPRKDPHTASMASARRDAPDQITGPVAMQCSRYFPKDSMHTELAGGEWLTKDEVRRIAAECRDRHIEIVPEVQSLSHAYYLCMAYPEIAERSPHDDPWPDTYCPSNPKSYEILFDVMDEVIEVFNPRMMHIGHDEAYTFKVCPRCRKRTGHDLFASDVSRVHAHLAERGVRAVMWGDKFMAFTDAKGVRRGGVLRRRVDPRTGKTWLMPPTWKSAALAPKDILIMDWYWSLDPESERHFNEAGFETVYGNFRPPAFKDWKRRASRPSVLGAEVSSWCEVSPGAYGHNGVLHSLYLGAHMLWTGKDLDRAAAFQSMDAAIPAVVDTLSLQPRRLVAGRCRARPLSIEDAASPVPAANAGALRPGERPTLPSGDQPFRLLVSPGGALQKAIVLSAAAPAASVAIDRKAAALLLLHGADMPGVFFRPTYYSFHRPPATLLRCRVRYSDGKSESFASVYGEDIGPVGGAGTANQDIWSDAALCFRSVRVPAGGGRVLYAQEWRNPRPNVEIKSLSFTLGPDAAAEGAVLIAAVSAAAS